MTETICSVCVVEKLDQLSTIDQLSSGSSKMMEMEVDLTSETDSEFEDESIDENNDDDIYKPQYDLEADYE